MAPKSAKWTKEGERLEQSLRRMDKELRRLRGMEEHQVQGGEGPAHQDWGWALQSQ